MRRYSVALPITGVFYVEVNAESKADAIDKALNEEGWPDKPEPDEWEVHEHITTGNVFHGTQNDAEAHDIGEAEEE